MCYIDLQATLAEWPYDADQISVRKILGIDGSVRIQMRVELGVLQMEAEGRPDGDRPFGCASLLQYHRERLARHEEASGTTRGFILSSQQCQDLRAEVSIYYRRYIALFVLEEYEDVVRDTSHNLDVFDLCHNFAREEEDRTCMELYRPYVLMMNARARALQAHENKEYASALAHINRGIMHIKTFYDEHGLLDGGDLPEELNMLRSLAAELGQQMPPDSIMVTRKALRAAIEREQFEEAARLRDMLNDLYDQPGNKSSG